MAVNLQLLPPRDFWALGENFKSMLCIWGYRRHYICKNEHQLIKSLGRRWGAKETERAYDQNMKEASCGRGMMDVLQLRHTILQNFDT